MNQDNQSLLQIAVREGQALSIRLVILSVVFLLMAWGGTSLFILYTQMKYAVAGVREPMSQSLTVGDTFQVRRQLHSLVASGLFSKMWLVPRGKTEPIFSTSLPVPEVVGTDYHLDWKRFPPEFLRHYAISDQFGLEVADLYLVMKLQFMPLVLIGLAISSMGCWLIWMVTRSYRDLALRLVQPVIQLSEGLSKGAHHIEQALSVDDSMGACELTDLRDAFRKVWNENKENESFRWQAEQLAYRVKLASQVAHDIRSPLMALKIATEVNNENSGEVYLIAHESLRRIEKIVEDLSNSSELHPNYTSSRRYSIEEPIKEVIREKRLQLQSNPNVQIIEILEAPNATVSLDSVTFKRVLSNLLNNAIESMTKRGEIIVRTLEREKEIRISVEDGGKGIPNQILPLLGREGTTYGKKYGTGLGLFHAKRCIESVGGKLIINSTEGVGTKVDLVFFQVLRTV